MGTPTKSGSTADEESVINISETKSIGGMSLEDIKEQSDEEFSYEEPIFREEEVGPRVRLKGDKFMKLYEKKV